MDHSHHNAPNPLLEAGNNPASQSGEECHPPEHNPWMKRIAIGAALLAGAVVIAPYLLPVVGVGETALAEEAMVAMHGTGLGNGLAGVINGVINSIPFVGGTLAQGGLVSAVASAGIGIGGMLLGNYIEKRQDGSTGIRWGKVLATAALATSALIALPSLLTGISVGVVYLAAAFSGVELASSAVAAMAASLGSVSSVSAGMTGLAGAAAAFPHLLTCVAPAISGAVSLGMLGSDDGKYTRSIAPAENPASTSDGQMSLQMEPQAELRINTPVTVKLRVTHTQTGKPVTAEELAIVHTEKLHLFVVDQSLKDYQHIHPQPTNEPGVFEYTFTPKTSNHYMSWADLELLTDRKQHRLKTVMAGQTNRSGAAYIIPTTGGTQNGVTCEWKCDKPLQAGQDNPVEITLKDPSGKPITDLEPIMGAFIHLVGFSADGKTMIHTHPEEKDPASANERGGPSFHFNIEPEIAGPAQFYIQISRDGVESYLPVGQIIKPPSMLAEKVQPQKILAQKSWVQKDLAQSASNIPTGYASI